jgi:hypothetical protein
MLSEKNLTNLLGFQQLEQLSIWPQEHGKECRTVLKK